ncbi:hypothetical protein HZA99_06655 [Candidatus Woesearchaeota archaeon]|nr:hypothetical protein [Candidatus Woesearchaeota archaeon]
MSLYEIVQKEVKTGLQEVKTILHEVAVLQPNEDAVIWQLYQPLMIEHEFEKHSTGVLTPAREIRMNPRIIRKMTQEHKHSYEQKVLERIQAYSVVIKKNKAINRAYQTPEFTPEDATEMAGEVFSESFQKAKKSYKR